MDTLIQFIWAISPSIFVGVVMAYFNRAQKKRTDAQEKREHNKVEYETLQLDLLLATAQLSYATAMAIKRGTPNGEMEVAIEQYDRAITKFRKYERSRLAETDR